MNLKSTILIVDDEPVTREIIEGLLMAEDYNLAFAGGGTEALAKATALTPDLILLDVMMPDMDGFEVCQHLRADPLLAEVPVIMVTALDDRPSRLKGIKVGADDFVTKPFDHLELRARVRTITRLNRYRRLLLERTRRQEAEHDGGEPTRHIEVFSEEPHPPCEQVGRPGKLVRIEVTVKDRSP